MAYIKPPIPRAKRGGNKRTVNLRAVVDGTMSVLSTDCQWRYSPKDLPPPSTVHGYFSLWDWDGTLDRIHHERYVQCRNRLDREASPTACRRSSSCAATFSPNASPSPIARKPPRRPDRALHRSALRLPRRADQGHRQRGRGPRAIHRKAQAGRTNPAHHRRRRCQNRRIKGGRPDIKQILFMPGLSAAKHDPVLSIVYKRLIASGKKPMIATIAIMRKIVVVANARLRDAFRIHDNEKAII